NHGNFEKRHCRSRQQQSLRQKEQRQRSLDRLRFVYGKKEAAKELPRNAVDFTPEVGMQLATETGLRGTITEVSEENFIVDFNHELAGKTLTFKIKVVSVEA
ncbi:MAG: hypothetical protein PHT13_10480, partial [Methanosarcina sp.]|nr:hypothetical protein [Methanosarcina sp.]